jgi:hypothetical protein
MPRDPSRSGRVGRVTARRPVRVTLPATFLLRVVVLAVASVVSAAWALHRYYTHPRVPMTVAVARDAGAWDLRDLGDAGTGLIEAPEIEIETR